VFCPGRVPAQDHNPWPTSGRVAPGKWGRRQVGGEAPMANRAADGAAPLAAAATEDASGWRGDGRQVRRRRNLSRRRTARLAVSRLATATEAGSSEHAMDKPVR
jgi:hypothetical protein